MSQNEYKIKLVVDDTALKDLEKRMGAIFSNKSSSKSGGSAESANPIKNLMKLGAIATGVGTLVYSVKKILDLTIDASPMLKGMLQLFNNSVMFILRPIGDFIGYLLKPIMVYILRYIAVPFYKHVAPFMQRYGNKVGEAIVGVLKFLSGNTTQPSTIQGTGKIGIDINGNIDWKTLQQNLRDNLTFGGLFDSKSPNYIFKLVNGKVLGEAWDKITGFFTGLKFDPIKTAWDTLTAVFNGINGGISTLLKAWDKLYAFFSPIGKAITDVFGKAWDSLSGFWQGINAGASTLFKAWSKLWSFFNPIISDITNIFSRAWDALTKFWQTILDFLKDPLGTIKKATTPTNQPNQVMGSNSVQVGIPQINITIDKAIGDVSKWGSDLEEYILTAIQKFYNKGFNP